ncbi:MAG: PSD1 and planctomycete cytochrome C domain-containing protein [Planctomycetota bacterium]
MAALSAVAGMLWVGANHTVAEPGAGAAATEQPGPTDPESLQFFEEHVRAILTDRCVNCHGGEKVRGGLNLATRELMLEGGVSGPAIDWQQLDQSLLLRAISYTDIDYEMPPTGKLPEAEIETLRQWVMMGSPWTAGEAGNLAAGHGEGHQGPISVEEGRKLWQYNPVEKPEVPEVDHRAWSQNAVDAFIFDKLDEAGLTPNPQADRKTLIRRATYDLTGLPPTPEEVAAFVSDERPDAWEKLIDRLLDSPHYGEKWARHWMDVVRYAETNGYERDGNKLNMWRYRDYLIRSFNDDKPYDRFVQEHIAGDELADADSDSIIATGYQRLQIWDDEPTDRPQARADYIADIVDTTGSAFLGMSIGCARCHDHKKDPITNDDYYSFYAFFNNITQPSRNPRGATRDLRDIPRSDAERDRIEQWETSVRTLRQQVAAAERDFRESAGGSFDRGELIAVSPSSEQAHQPWYYRFEDPGEGWYVQATNHRDWPEARGGFSHNVDTQKRPSLPNALEGEEVYLRRNFRLTQVPRFLTLRITHKGPTQVYINGAKVYDAGGPTGQTYHAFQLPAEALRDLVVGSNSIAIKSRKARDAQWFIDAGLYEGIVDPRSALLASIESRGEEVLGAPRYAAYRSHQADLKRLLDKPVNQAYPATVIAEPDRTPEEQYIHERGSVHGKGPIIQAGFPEVLGGGDATPVRLPEDIKSSGQRLALAQWLTRSDNPMTARVMVNRLWQHHFGKGIIESTSEFGQLGTPATHPELLDYLAARFVESGWSIKDMHRLMMNSQAYRMASSAQQAGLDRDPTNTLLWRFNMRRLTAEEFRDSVLKVNGSLNPELFGPSIYTKMPQAVLATASRPDRAWGNSPEHQRDRRSVYIYIKRSLREPLLAALDQAETDTPCPVRFTTTVPTQTLITINGDFVQEEAAVFAQHLLEAAPEGLEAQVRLGLKLVMGRFPEPEQLEENLAFVREIKQEHGLDDARALRVFAVVCFNLNEFMYID